METLQAVWAKLVALWKTGNRWCRWAIAVSVFWPIVLVAVALTGLPLLISLLALLPVLAIMLSLLAAIDPLVVAIVGAFGTGRTVLRTIATVIGTELVIGVYFSIIPVWNDRGLIPVLILVMVAIGFLSIGIKGKVVKTTISILAVIAVVITAIFVLGGREKLKAPLPQPLRISTTQPAPLQQWQLCWEKKPEHEGKTGIRRECLSARVESRTDAHVVISYTYPGGRGVMEGTSTDGIGYDGEWKDSTGWGKWHLRFVSSDAAFGWSDDEGEGEKIPNVLEKK